MKKQFLFFGTVTLLLTAWACNDNRSTTSTSDDTTNTMNTGGDTVNTLDPNTTNNNPPVSATPLNKDDSMFVMDAALGSLLEVESGKLAQQNGASQAVKDFGAMMVTDHGKASQELLTLASNHGIGLSMTLPADKQKHLDDMKKMTGKAFDRHYVNMMVSDHQKDISKFKKASTSAASDDLKTWATNTLPTLQKHLDSIQAVKKRI